MSKKLKKGLTLQQERFCKLYASDAEFFANGTQSYMEAYGYKPEQYKVAMAAASRLLRDVNILARINEILELGELNDGFVDKQLNFVITQNSDLSGKVAGIREYNRLKKRVEAAKVKIDIGVGDIYDQMMNGDKPKNN